MVVGFSLRLDLRNWLQLRIIKKIKVTHNTTVFVSIARYYVFCFNRFTSGLAAGFVAWRRRTPGLAVMWRVIMWVWSRAVFLRVTAIVVRLVRKRRWPYSRFWFRFLTAIHLFRTARKTREASWSFTATFHWSTGHHKHRSNRVIITVFLHVTAIHLFIFYVIIIFPVCTFQFTFIIEKCNLKFCIIFRNISFLNVNFKWMVLFFYSFGFRTFYFF